MAQEIDVYREWLGIEETARPLNHYQLLRLKPFEDKAAKIHSHYRKMNAYVRKFAVGEHADRSQEILNELAKAMLCLTDAERKRGYDESLGREFEPELTAAGNLPLGAQLCAREIINKAQLAEAEQYAERRGLLKPGQTVVEATSGNTGIALAMVCAAKGYPLVIVMAENFSVERRKIIRFLGARVVLTPASLRGMGMIDKARELADAHGWFLCRQFENEANAEVHARTTAREILEDFAGEPLDYWVTGFGTGGTLNGVSRVLKRARPATQVVGG